MLSNITTHDAAGFQRTHPALAGAALGIEVGSLATFFSMQRPALGAVTVEQSQQVDTPDTRVLTRVVRYPDAYLRIEETEREGSRTLEVEALADSELMDAVIRFVIPRREVTAVYLNERHIPWARRNHYHQEENARVRMQLANGETFRLHVEVEAPGLPAGMDQMTYVRDEPDDWVLHARVRANKPDLFSLRGCMRYYNRPLPRWIQAIWSRLPGLPMATLHVRERVSQRIPFQTNGAVWLKKGQRLRFTAYWTRDTVPA